MAPKNQFQMVTIIATPDPYNLTWNLASFISHSLDRDKFSFEEDAKEILQVIRNATH